MDERSRVEEDRGKACCGWCLSSALRYRAMLGLVVLAGMSGEEEYVVCGLRLGVCPLSGWMDGWIELRERSLDPNLAELRAPLFS